MASVQSSNAGRHARASLMDIYKAERSWDGWNSDAVAIANDLINQLLQAHNAQEPAVWHPSIQPYFPDLPEKYLSSALATAKEKLQQLEHKMSMMVRQVERIEAAANLLVGIGSGVSGNDEPLVLDSVSRYGDLGLRVAGAYRRAVDERERHLVEIRNAIEELEHPGSMDSVKAVLLDSDEQLVKLSSWLHSPGLKDALLFEAPASSTLMVSDFDEMLRVELGIEEI
ncbi:hypothetical protein GGI07_005843 [Coemansia sp. Benny D115]|nr:hypothetical protein GGI07_005843 [Coemansia sp. Benny D115]